MQAKYQQIADTEKAAAATTQQEEGLASRFSTSTAYAIAFTVAGIVALVTISTLPLHTPTRTTTCIKTASSSISPSSEQPQSHDHQHINSHNAEEIVLLTSVDALVYPTNSSVEYILKEPCGNASSEAKERGCHFDMVELAWLPTECYDPELETELETLRDWEFWEHANGTGAMTWQDVQRGDFDTVLTTSRFHRHHCAYRGYKFFRAVVGRGLSSVSSRIAGWHHMQHCRDAILNPDQDPDQLRAAFQPAFPDCGVLRWRGSDRTSDVTL